MIYWISVLTNNPIARYQQQLHYHRHEKWQTRGTASQKPRPPTPPGTRPERLETKEAQGQRVALHACVRLLLDLSRLPGRTAVCTSCIPVHVRLQQHSNNMVGLKALPPEILLMIRGHIDGVRDAPRKNCTHPKCLTGIDYISNVATVAILDRRCHAIFNQSSFIAVAASPRCDGPSKITTSTFSELLSAMPPPLRSNNILSIGKPASTKRACLDTALGACVLPRIRRNRFPPSRCGCRHWAGHNKINAYALVLPVPGELC